jgi:hemolysin III
MFPEYTRNEWLVDGVIHALGVGASLIAAATLLYFVVATRDAPSIISAAIYGAGLVATFGFSAAYHLAVRPNWKKAIRRYDHAAIFLMIAGTYTPFALIGVGGAVGVALLASVWLIALTGMLFKLLRPRRIERASVFLYLGLGWLGLPAAGSLVAALPAAVVVLLCAGGLLYTIGVAFHSWKTLPQHNAVWHALVLAAAGCHYVAVFEVVVSA